MIKVIIFDFAGIIGADGYWIWLRKNVPDIESRKASFQELSEQLDSGKISLSEFIEEISERTGIPKKKIREEIYKETVINKDLLELIQKLKKKYKIGLLSNSSFEWLNTILTENKLFSYFDEFIISSQFKIIKPNPAIFHKMLEMFEIKPEEAIFIDDRQPNVDAGNKQGIKSLLYSSNRQLVEDLKRLHLI